MKKTASTVVCIALAALFALVGKQRAVAQTPDGMISGTVTADSGTVRGFRVKAKDTTRKISYTVFTRAGRYQVPDLLPGAYEVRVLEKGYKSPVEKLELKPGENKTVDLALHAEEATRVEAVDYDTLYPPGPGRALLERNCMGCHGRDFYHRQQRNEDGWRFGVNKMTSLTPTSSSNANGVPTVAQISAEDKETIVRYLVTNFGPNSPRRELKLDPLLVDEQEVGDAVFIEYDPPDFKIPETAKLYAITGNRSAPLARGQLLHDPYIAPDGSVWYANPGNNVIYRLDQRERNPQKRWKEYPIAGPNVGLHGIALDSKGRVYWAEIAGGSLGELDPKTGETNRHKFPTGGAMLQVAVDSKDNVWYGLISGSEIGKWDAKAKKMFHWPIPTPNADLYGLTVDHKDNVWAVEIAGHKLVKLDPVTEKITEYPTPTQPSGPRRLGVDSKGKIWFSEYFGNALGVLDPDTGKIVEYKFPLRYTQAYETWPDTEDNIWVSDNVYNSLIKFDPRTKKFTYYPLPQFGYTIPKIEIGKDGTIWFGSRGVENITAVNLRPTGNSLKKIGAR